MNETVKKINLLLLFFDKILLPHMKKATNNFLNKKLAALWLFIALLVPSAGVWAQGWATEMQKPDANFYQVQAKFNEYWAGKTPEKGQGYRAFRRWEWYWGWRVDDQGRFPSPYLQTEEWDKYRSAHPNVPENATSNWASQGPFTTTGGYFGIGRINCIAFHPTNVNTFWIGSAGGGVWRTINGGTNWTNQSDFLPVTGVSSIVVHPTDPNILYMATGDANGYNTPSVGVYRSGDGGNTWAPSGLTFAPNQNYFIRQLIMQPGNPNVIYAATNGGLYRTTNGGTNWTLISASTLSFRELEFKPGSSTVMYACTDPGSQNAQILVSNNAGDTWTSAATLSNIGRISLAVSPASPDRVYALAALSSNGGFGGMFRSDNTGASFQNVYSGPINLLHNSASGSGTGGQGWYDLALAVSPTNGSEVYVGGINVWKSTTAGNGWALATIWAAGNFPGVTAQEVHADQHFMAYQPGNNRLYVCNDGSLYYTDNGGTNWTNRGNGLAISQLYRMAHAASNPNITLAGAQDNSTFVRNSGGAWAYGPSLGDGMEVQIDETNPNTQYAASYYGSVWRSLNAFANQGSSRVLITNNIPGGQPQGDWITPYVLDPNNQSSVVIGFRTVYRSNNRGDSWSAISPINFFPQNLTSLAVARGNSNVIYAATPTQIWATTDGGANWANVTSNLSTSNNRISRIAIHPTNPQRVWVTLSGYVAGSKVFMSNNGGQTWANMSGSLPNLPVNCVAIDRQVNEGVYVGMDVGVYYRDASMANWVLFSTNLPNVEIFDLEIHYGARQLQAATYGRGVWRSPLAVGLSTAPPTITSFTPTSGPVGTSVTITGTNFLGVTAVSFNNVNAPSFIVNSATELIALVPSGATTGRIRVTSGLGTATSATDFTVTAPQPPTVTSFSPTSGPVGTSVAIMGTNFTGATSVSFNNVNAATFTVNSATQITATVPAGATTGRVRVVTTGGTGTSATDFTVTIPAGSCGNTTLTAASGTVTDGSGSNDYQDNLSCSWLVQPPGATSVTLTFTQFATEAGYDFVRVYNGSNASAPLLGTFSGTSLPPVLTANSGRMFITFSTDISVTAAGWSANYASVTQSSSCLLTPTGLTGTSWDANTRVLTKTAGSGWNNASARSQETLPANADGWVEWEIPAITTTFYMAGLADAASAGNWANVDYGIYYAAGQIYVYHTTTGILYTGRIAAAGDRLRVWKRGDRVNFYHNGTALMPFYDYPANPATPLFFDVSFFSNGASLRNPTSSFCRPAAAAPCALAWANVAGATFNAANNTLTKTAATGWGNAGAVSQNSLPANTDGGISWTIPTGPLDATFYMLGLSATSPDNSWASVQYGLYYAAGQVYVYLSGANQGFYGNAQPGDRLSIFRTGGSINFYRNNKSFFGTAAPANVALIADLAMFSSGARVQGLQGHNMCTATRPLAVRAEEAQALFESPSLAVYPNPTSGRFTVALGSLGRAELVVLDVLGREVLRQAADGPLATLDLAGQPAGTYLVRVRAEGYVQTVKIAKE
jgi:hypothetical protein